MKIKASIDGEVPEIYELIEEDEEIGPLLLTNPDGPEERWLVLELERDKIVDLPEGQPEKEYVGDLDSRNIRFLRLGIDDDSDNSLGAFLFPRRRKSF